MSPSKIKRKYKKRITAILNGLRSVLLEAGHTCSEPDDTGCDDYRWSMVVDADDDFENGIDVSFTICESERCDGEKGGVNFMLDIVEFGGRMLGGLCPYNYSDNVWVSREDVDGIEQRFRIMEDADAESVLDCFEAVVS